MREGAKRRVKVGRRLLSSKHNKELDQTHSYKTATVHTEGLVELLKKPGGNTAETTAMTVAQLIDKVGEWSAPPQ